MTVDEIRNLSARKMERIEHTGYAIPEHRELDLEICSALYQFAEVMQRLAEAREDLGKEKSGTTWTKLGVEELILDFIEKGVRHPCDVG